MPAKKPSNSHSKLLTPTEAADRLLIAPVTVRVWANRGLLPSLTTPGGHRRFRIEDIDAFAAQQLEARRAESLRPSRILIIDDDPKFSRYLATMLQKHIRDLQIEIATDGFEAGMKCGTFRPNVVTLDLEMPRMNGFDVCKLLREMPDGSHLRIVALTGFASDDNIKKILKAGADSCLSKTAPRKELLRELGFP